MKRILTGSIHQNPTDLQAGSVTEQIIDRVAQISSDLAISWSGSDLSFTSDIQLQFPLAAGGALAINSIPLAASPLALSNNSAIIARINRTAGITAMSAGTYPGLNAGEYAIVSLASVNMIDIDRKDHVVLFRRLDTPSGSQRLLVPLHKQVILEGQSIILGTAPGSPDIFTSTFLDPVSTVLPTGATVQIDGIAGVNGDTVLYTALASGNNRIYALSGVGTSIAWNPLDVFLNNSIDPVNADLCKILKGVGFADQIAMFDGTNWTVQDKRRQFNGANYFEESSIKEIVIANNQVAPADVFSVTALGSENCIVTYSVVRGLTKDAGQIYITHDNVNTSTVINSANIGSNGVAFISDISGGNLRLRYTSTNTVTGLMKFSIMRWSDLSQGGPTGVPSYSALSTIPLGYLNSAFAMSDGSGIEVGCSTPTVVLGKTQLALAFSYTMSVNPGTTAGDLEVLADGLVMPRYIAGVTNDAYYTEIDSTTIQFWTDVTSPVISLEVRRKQGTVDTASANGARINSFQDATVGTLAQFNAGVATHTTINAALNDINVPKRIRILPGTYVENISINRNVVFEGYGITSVIQGTLIFTSASLGSYVTLMKITGNVTFNASSTSNVLINSWQNTASTITDLGTNNYYIVSDV